MIIVEFNEASGILEAKFQDDVTLAEVIGYIDKTRRSKRYPRVLKILTDATRAKMNFSASDLTAIVEANYHSLLKYEFIIDAIVLDSPKETALSVLYQELAKTQKYRFKVCSTRKAALEWLDSNNYPQ